MDSEPELKQVGDLSAQDFERYPIWVRVLGVDIDEPWEDKADECTRRPWGGDLPYPWTAADLWSPPIQVRVEYTLADGTCLAGYITPPFPPGSGPDPFPPALDERDAHLGRTQPALFLPSNETVFIYLGPVPIYRGPDGRPNPEDQERFEDRKQQRKRTLYGRLAKLPSEVFPIRFRVSEGLLEKEISGEIRGFAYLDSDLRLITET